MLLQSCASSIGEGSVSFPYRVNPKLILFLLELLGWGQVGSRFR